MHRELRFKLSFGWSLLCPEDNFMLSILLTYHDALYLATELGLLTVVLLAGWLMPRLEQQGHS